MTHDVYYEFHQNLEQLRRHGARGGKATVRNRHERLQGAAAEAPEREREGCAAGRYRNHRRRDRAAR